jgi:hypothetical protein
MGPEQSHDLLVYAAVKPRGHAVMPRYYFHLASKQKQLRDPDGRELPDLDAAHRHAVKMIDKMMLYLPHEDFDGWVVEVCNAADAVELVVLVQRRAVQRRSGERWAYGRKEHGR